MNTLSLEEFRRLSVKEEIDYDDPDKLFEAIKKKAVEVEAY